MIQNESVRKNLVPIGTAVDLLRQDYPDVSHSSMRFLEREGLVIPSRTAGGHRLYSPAALQRVRQIKEWQGQRLSLDEIRMRLEDLDSVASPEDLATRFLDSALAGEMGRARRTILDADNVGLPLSTLLMDVLRSALWELGERWERGAVSVAQEKEVSELAIELIAELALRHSGSNIESRGSVVAACVAGEEHELGLRIIATLLRSRHINVHFLGSSVDPEFLVDAVLRRQPGIILLSATGDEHLSALRQAVDALRQAGISTPVLAGGQAVRRRQDTIVGWGIELADDDTDAIVSRLVATKPG